MKPVREAYRFSTSQRKGIVALCLLIVILQAAWFVIGSAHVASPAKRSAEEKQWLALQPQIDALKAAKAKKTYTIYPFNPNFISDYKGYALGMTTAQIDRLLAFRKSRKFVNSAADFKQVTQVPDSIFNKISPYFKFPDWVVKRQQEQTQNGVVPNAYTDGYTKYTKAYADKKEAKPVVKIDINNALEEDLVEVYGIGPAFAKKILRRRAELGAFVSMDQMDDFKEFSPEAIAGLKKGYVIGPNPQPVTINVNSASLQQLSHFPYFNRDIAKAIITQRSMKGKITNFDELSKINDIFTLKSKIIALYLEY